MKMWGKNGDLEFIKSMSEAELTRFCNRLCCINEALFKEISDKIKISTQYYYQISN